MSQSLISSKGWGRVAVVRVLFAILLVTGLSSYALLVMFYGEESLASKQEWSVLQVLEYRHRGKQLPHVVVEDFEGCIVVGILGDDRASRTWIMLNPRYGFVQIQGLRPILLPRVKVMCPAGYSLSLDEFNRLTALPGTTSDATRELRAHLRP